MRAIAQQPWLDAPGFKLEHGFATALNLLRDTGEPVRNLLNGTPLGHPLHPVITDLPLGAWTAAAVLDGMDAARPRSADFRAATDAVLVTGLAGAAGAAVTGLADWQYTHGKARRVGLVHGAVNAAALGLYAGSLVARRRGRRRAGRLLAAVGYVTVSASAYLGGDLVYRRRVGVDHADDALQPRRFTAAIPLAELPDGSPHLVQVCGVDIVLIRRGDEVRAYGGHCPHLGAPLGDGWLHRDHLVCPWHGSRFDLTTGEVRSGPATGPLPRFEARVRGGFVEVRRHPDAPGATPDSVLAAEQAEEDDPARH